MLLRSTQHKQREGRCDEIATSDDRGGSRSLSTDLEQLLLDPSRARADAADLECPLTLVDLTTWPADVPIPLLPLPVIGMGDRQHPRAAELDAVVEPPVTIEVLVRQIERAPRAAAATVQLLRSLEGVTCQHALTFESACYAMLQGSAEHAAWLAGRPVSTPAPPGKLVVTRDDAVLHIVLDRPQARNAIDRSLRDALCEAFTVATIDTEVKRVQLTSIGSAFSVGGDLDEFGTMRDPVTAHLIRARTLPARAMVPRAEIFSIYVQGACVGAGLEIAAFAGTLKAASDAWFQLPELSMGLIPGAGGCVSVPRRIGRQRAALMMLSGKRINAATALRWGLIDAIENLPPVDEGGADVSRV